MTIISFFGVLLALLAIPIFLRGATYARLAIGLALIVIHLAVTQVYYIYTKTNIADAFSYYYYGGYFNQFPWSTLGTVFVGHVTQLLKKSFGATYLDCFMVFQAFGACGIILLMRIFHEIYEKVQAKETSLLSLILFLPSLHFWTSAIGKDAPVFFAVALATWSMLNISARKIPLIISIVVLIFFRVHVALAAVVALSLASLIEPRFTVGRKAMLLVIALIGTSFLLSSVQSTFSVDLTDASSVSKFMDARGAAEATDFTSTGLNSSIFLRLIGLLFRPFFFDARNAFGLVASVENLGSLYMFGYLILNFRSVKHLSKNVLFVRFCLFLTALIILMLAPLNYNVGLGLRERVMIYPPLFSLFLATLAFRRTKASAKRPQAVVATRPVAGSMDRPDRLPAA